MLMKVVMSIPSECFKNHALVNASDLPNTNHVKIKVNGVNTFVLSVKSSSTVNRNEIRLNRLNRKWLNVVCEQEVDVLPFEIDLSKRLVSMTIQIDFQRREKPETYKLDEMAADFIYQFSDILFSTNQLHPFRYKGEVFNVLVHELEAINIHDGVPDSTKPQKVSIGLLNKDTVLTINTTEYSLITLINKSTIAQSIYKKSIISPNLDFNELGIGGLDKELTQILQRVFASQILSLNVGKCNGRNIKGIILYGPPGTGKTLIARKIGDMLRSRPPKVINGPEILNKFVGESEANIRRLFIDAEDEEKRLGPNSALHIIIFDEIDAICKKRVIKSGGNNVHETIVSQLLSKIDGVNQLNNILMIGTTNRLDLIDDALLRPGRFEIKLQIGLPDEKGRLQILKIHTAEMLKNNLLAPDVDLEDLAKRSKNFTGAEIEALTRAAYSIALNRVIKITPKVEFDYEAVNNLQIYHNDFLLALENDIKPAFDTNSQFSDKFVENPIDHLCQEFDIVDGTVEIQTEQDFKHDGIFLTIEGVLNLQSNLKGSRLFNNNIKPLVILSNTVQLLKIGKLNIGNTTLPFKLSLVPKSGYDLYESYHGVCININYTLKCEIKRGFLLKDVVCFQEIIVQYKPVKNIESKPYSFQLDKKSLRNLQKFSELPQFNIYGYFDTVECSIDDPFSGEISVDVCDIPIKSIVVVLNRIENCSPAEDSFQEETEVQSIQIADGDIIRSNPIPIYFLFPRLLCCPTITTRFFKIEFSINISITLEDGNLISEDFPLRLHRVIK